MSDVLGEMKEHMAAEQRAYVEDYQRLAEARADILHPRAMEAIRFVDGMIAASQARRTRLRGLPVALQMFHG